MTAPENIYLLPDDDHGYAWCDCPDPTDFHHPEEAIKYVREDTIEVLQADRDQQYDMKVKAREQRDAVTAKLKALQVECHALKSELAESRANDRQAMAYLEAVREIVGGDSFPEMIGLVKELQIERNGYKLAFKEQLEKSERAEENRK